MKLYTVQYAVSYAADDTAGDQLDVTVWCASIADATEVYNAKEKQAPTIRIVTLPSGREEMAKFLNERGVKV